MTESAQRLIAELDTLRKELEHLKHTVNTEDGINDEAEKQAQAKLQQDIEEITKDLNDLQIYLDNNGKVIDLSEPSSIEKNMKENFDKAEKNAREFLKSHIKKGKKGMTLELVLKELEKQRYGLAMTPDDIRAMVLGVAKANGVELIINDELPSLGSALPKEPFKLEELTQFSFTLDATTMTIKVPGELIFRVTPGITNGHIHLQLKGTKDTDFSFAVLVDNNEQFTMSLMGTYNPQKNQAKVGASITTKKKVCVAEDADKVKAEMINIGQKLNKQMKKLVDLQGRNQEREDILLTLNQPDGLGANPDLVELVTLVGQMYGKAEKLKGSCKEVPVISLGGEILYNGDTGDTAATAVISFHF